jgi:deazaflavin-dependent oxidoreductase (nitroreductase family)
MSDGADFNAQNIEEFRANHGRVSGPFEGAPLVILHTVGARSGEPRTNIMMYLADGDLYLLFASNAGAGTHPAWYFNVRAHPRVRIEVGDDVFDAKATELTGAERDEKYAEGPPISGFRRLRAEDQPHHSGGRACPRSVSRSPRHNDFMTTLVPRP